MHINQIIDQLKTKGFYFSAGVVKREAGQPCNYGCHFGMRSELDHARAQFKLGYDAARSN